MNKDKIKINYDFLIDDKILDFFLGKDYSQLSNANQNKELYNELLYANIDNILKVVKKLNFTIKDKGIYPGVRKKYIKELIHFCIENNKVNDFINIWFSKSRIITMLNIDDVQNIDTFYFDYISRVLNNINNKLIKYDLKIIKADKSFDIIYSDSIPIDTNIKIYEFDYYEINNKIYKIKELLELNWSEYNYYEEAIGTAESMLEGYLAFLIRRKKNVKKDYFHNKGLNDLFKETMRLFDLEENNELKKSISKISNSLLTISHIRNSYSNAHDDASMKIKVEKSIAEFYFDISISIIKYLYNTTKEKY